MSTLTGKTPAQTYKDLLQVSNNNAGIDSTLRTVSDGEATDSPLQLSVTKVQAKGSGAVFEVANSSGTVLFEVDTTLNTITAKSGVSFEGDGSGLTGVISVGTGGASSTTNLQLIADSGALGTGDIIIKIGAQEIGRIPQSERTNTAYGTVPYLKRKNLQWLHSNGFGIVTEDLLVPHQLLANNWAILDTFGNYHWMVEIPRKNWDPINTFASATIHPAFTVNGLQRRIFVGKYQMSQNGSSQYVTSANVNVKQTINFDVTDAACNALNGGGITGFHLMTNAEWALVALISKYLNTMPKGNNDYGRDVDDKFVTGVLESGSEANFGSVSPARWIAGSGGIQTSHDNTPAGIFDLNGNVWEWVRGMRINVGEIQILADNNAADYTKDVSSGSAEWKAILQDGSLVAPGTALTLKYDGHTIDTTSTTATNGTFETLAAASGVTIPDILKSLALFPYTTGLNSDYHWLDITSERLPLRGGSWGSGSFAGVFALYLRYLRSDASNIIGFRGAFVL